MLPLPPNIQNMIHTKTGLTSHSRHHSTMVLTEVTNVLIHWFALCRRTLHYMHILSPSHSFTHEHRLPNSAHCLQICLPFNNLWKCSASLYMYCDKQTSKNLHRFLTFSLWYLKTCSMFRTQKTVICAGVNEKIPKRLSTSLDQQSMHLLLH